MAGPILADALCMWIRSPILRVRAVRAYVGGCVSPLHPELPVRPGPAFVVMLQRNSRPDGSVS